MRWTLAIAAAAVVSATAGAMAQGQNHVNGYVRNDGTYVAPHFRTNPDNSRTNNWSSQGNTNPYTGQPGTVNPYTPPPPPPPAVNNFNAPRQPWAR